jgi:SAM-dependent methyltransferase
MDLLTVVDPLVPRPSVEEVSLVGENLNVAFEFLNYFIEFCGLWPAAAVLDVGCGVGRMAYGLAHVLNDEGSYEGFDIVERFIQVAAARFQSLANFRFHHVDVLNGLYNPGGKLIPSEFRFPYRDASFDLVVLASVFTHMRPEEVSHYLDEIRRVLRPGGKCLASVFLLERESKRLIACGRAPLPLRPVDGGFYAADPANPEWAIGHEEDAVLDALARRGFRSERILRGSWCGRSAFTSYQDVLIFGR